MQIDNFYVGIAHTITSVPMNPASCSAFQFIHFAYFSEIEGSAVRASRLTLILFIL